MLILRDVDAFQPEPARPLILALGNFDGIHLGHARILKRVVLEARKKKGRAAILTFQEHPQQILNPGSRPPLLTSPDYKLFLLSELGMEVCFLLPFTKKFSKFEPTVFAEKILAGKLKVKKICLGYNAHFGHDRKGDAGLMKKLAEKFGFEFEEIPPVKAAGDFVSSTRIRKLLEEGDLKKAALCLGRPHSILAKVVRGEGRGRALGFPTANLKLDSDVMPPKGVYPVKVRLMEFKNKTAKDGKSCEFRGQAQGPWLKGVLNYGVRPTFKGAAAPTAEVFILDFDGDLYGKQLEVNFYPKIRSEKKFSNIQALTRQIDRDILKARQSFKNMKKTFTRCAN